MTEYHKVTVSNRVSDINFIFYKNYQLIIQVKEILHLCFMVMLCKCLPKIS